MSGLNDPYQTLTEREQDLLHQREMERITLTHNRRVKIIEFFVVNWLLRPDWESC